MGNGEHSMLLGIPGYPNACGSDYIRKQDNVYSLQACQDLCSAESDCQFVAYNRVGDRRCGLYRSQCQGQTHTSCDTTECYYTYQKQQYVYYGAGYPNACGGSDYIRKQDNVYSLQACQDLCSAESDCQFVAYNRVGDRRCGLYRSQCQGQTHTSCDTTECYYTYQQQYVYYGAGYPNACGG